MENDDFIYSKTPRCATKEHLPEHKVPATAKAYIILRTMSYNALTLKDKHGKTWMASKRKKIGKATLLCTQLQTCRAGMAGAQESGKKQCQQLERGHCCPFRSGSRNTWVQHFNKYRATLRTQRRRSPALPEQPHQGAVKGSKIPYCILGRAKKQIVTVARAPRQREPQEERAKHWNDIPKKALQCGPGILFIDANAKLGSETSDWVGSQGWAEQENDNGYHVH